jgi:hypothetical protein
MYHNGPAPIPCSAFNRDGTMYAYAVSACGHICNDYEEIALRRASTQVSNRVAAANLKFLEPGLQAGLHWQ